MDLRKIHRINHIAYPVSDLRRSRTFYELIFGAKYSGSLGDTIFLWIGDTDLTLEQSSSTDLKRAGHLGIYLENESLVDDFADHLKKNQVEIIEGPKKRSDAYFLYFQDPDGNGFEIFYNYI
ncbi:VOC family protein [bacterium]|nr:VOC family protein [bacterium]